MKKVRYLAGAAGLAPAVVGLALPTATYAAAAPSATGQAKTVSLYHTGAVPAAGCTGSTEFYVPKSGHVEGHGWYATGGGSVCIGTVVGKMYFTKSSFCKYVHLNINGTNMGSRKECTGSGSKSVWESSGTFAVHKWFHGHAKVCLWSTYQTFFTCKTVP
jgi:hypothetical protein